MQAIRQSGIVKEGMFVLHLPEELNSKEIEVIIFPVEKKSSDAKDTKFKLSSLEGTFSNETEKSIDKKIKSLRSEWKRDM